MMRILLVALAISPFLGPTTVRAQTCAEGRVASTDTEGRCCWPGQRWSAAAARCDGPPTCPPGRVAEGDACVPSAAPAVGPPSGVAPPTAITPPTGTASWPSAPPDGPPGLRDIVARTGSDFDLQLSGALLLGLSYAVALAITLPLALQEDYCGFGSPCNETLAPFAAVPFAHWVGAFAANQSQAVPIVIVGGLMSAVELAGLVMALVGTTRISTDLVLGELSLDVGPGGVALRGRF